jgi:hypothetical protein
MRAPTGPPWRAGAHATMSASSRPHHSAKERRATRKRRRAVAACADRPSPRLAASFAVPRHIASGACSAVEATLPSPGGASVPAWMGCHSAAASLVGSATARVLCIRFASYCGTYDPSVAEPWNQLLRGIMSEVFVIPMFFLIAQREPRRRHFGVLSRGRQCCGPCTHAPPDGNCAAAAELPPPTLRNFSLYDYGTFLFLIAETDCLSGRDCCSEGACGSLSNAACPVAF